MHIYKYNNNDNQILEDLLADNQQYQMLKGDQGLIEIDLSKYKIIFPKDGVFLDIEIIKDRNFVDNNIYPNKEKKVAWSAKKLYLENVLCDDLNVTWDFVSDEKVSNKKGYWVDFNKQRKIFYKKLKDENNLEHYFIPAFGLKVKQIK